jgi:hypothetical protein
MSSTPSGPCERTISVYATRMAAIGSSRRAHTVSRSALVQGEKATTNVSR